MCSVLFHLLVHQSGIVRASYDESSRAATRISIEIKKKKHAILTAYVFGHCEHRIST